MTVAEIDDLFAPEVITDPYTYFAALRETGPGLSKTSAQASFAVVHEGASGAL